MTDFAAKYGNRLTFICSTIGMGGQMEGGSAEEWGGRGGSGEVNGRFSIIILPKANEVF